MITKIDCWMYEILIRDGSSLVTLYETSVSLLYDRDLENCLSHQDKLWLILLESGFAC